MGLFISIGVLIAGLVSLPFAILGVIVKLAIKQAEDNEVRVVDIVSIKEGGVTKTRRMTYKRP